MEPTIHALPHPVRQPIEGAAVDQVAERVAEEARLQVEVAQRPAPSVARPAPRERRGEGGDARNRCRERCLTREQHVGDRRFDPVVEARTRPAASIRGPRGAGVRHDARQPGEPGQVVRHLGLVLQGHQRDDVAPALQITRHVGLASEVGQVPGPGRVEPVRPGWIARDRVASVCLRTVRAGHIPAAPPFGERGAVVGHHRAEPEVRLSRRLREDRSNVEAGNAERGRPIVAPETTVTPLQPRRPSAGSIQLVEGDAKTRVDGRQLDPVGAGDEGDRHVVVEVDGTRPAGRDLPPLQAGLGEDQNLRVGVDVQPAEEAAQMAGAVAGEAQRGAPVREAEAQIVHGVGRQPASKAARRIVDRDGLLVQLDRARRRRSNAEQHEPDTGGAGDGLPSQDGLTRTRLTVPGHQDSARPDALRLFYEVFVVVVLPHRLGAAARPPSRPSRASGGTRPSPDPARGRRRGRLGTRRRSRLLQRESDRDRPTLRRACRPRRRPCR